MHRPIPILSGTSLPLSPTSIKKNRKLTCHNNPYNVYDEAVGYMRMFLDRFSKLQVHIKFFNHDGLVDID